MLVSKRVALGSGGRLLRSGAAGLISGTRVPSSAAAALASGGSFPSPGGWGAAQGAVCRGRRTVNVAPAPGWLAAVMVPPRSAITCWVMNRPSPVPPWPLVVK